MKPSLSAVSMAVVASAAASVGVARGFNLAKHLARPRAFHPPPPPSRRPRPPPPAFRRSASPPSCFVARDGRGSGGDDDGGATTTSTSLSSAPTAREDAVAVPPADGDDDVERAARSALGITGALPPPVDFGGIPYLDTTPLESHRSHRVLFVLGGPGVGKGTQSERIVDTYKCVHLSVGDLLRSGAEREGYPHADLVKECLVQGKIVPVELSLGLLRIAMDEAAEDGEDAGYGSRIFLVDGFPRNYDNVRGWMENMPSYTAVLGALVYNCPIEVLEGRIMSRAETSGRSDDNLESARRRFETFKEQTEPIVRALERTQEMQADDDSGGSRLNIVNIDATGTVEEVWKVTEAAMDAYVRNDVLTANSNLLKAIEEGDAEKFADLCEGNPEVDPVFEGPAKSSVSNARVHIRDGVEATVSYDRKMKGNVRVRETREWSHGPRGWKCVGVSREE